MDNKFFKHYEGTEPFIFISYAHSDSDEVMRIITDMHSRGFRLWYDEGIDAGEEWQESIASHLVDSDLIICFISNSYTASENCRKELSYALSKKKKIISVFLEETQLSPGLELQLGNIFALMKYTYPSEGYFYTKFYESELINEQDYGCIDKTINISRKQEKDAAKVKKHKEKNNRKNQIKKEREEKPRKRKRWIAPLVIFIVLLALSVTALVIGYFTGYLERIQTPVVKVETLSDDTVALFSNDLIEKAAREYTGKEPGDITVADLTGLSSLYFIGNKYYFDNPIDYEIEDISSTETVVTLTSGDNVTIERGSISDFNDFAYFPSLTTLSVQYQKIENVKSLPACRIQVLDISGNKIKSLEGICNLPNLRQIVADGCPILDVSTLNQCLDLRDVSLINSNVDDLSPLKPLLKLTTVRLSNCTVSELMPVLRNSHIKVLGLYDSDLRGSFFKSFDREKAITDLAFVRCQFDSFSGIEEFSGLVSVDFVSCNGVDESQLSNIGTNVKISIS